MKPKVIVYKKMDASVLEYVRNYCDITYFEKLDAGSYPAFLSALREAEGILGSGLRVDQALLDQAPRLKIVCNTSAGYDNLDLPELRKRGIMATNTPDVLNETVADAVFGLLLATARRMPELDRAVRTGKWKSQLDSSWYGVDVHHKVLGIIGLGGIGDAIAKRASLGFGMEILYHNRSRNEDCEKRYNARYCSLDELLSQSDYVCLMTPLTPKTQGMIGQREFGLMKDSAIFVNGSRGATVDEEALVQALRQKKIRAAGLDVFAEEPLPPDHALLQLDNAVLLPHIGSATGETRLKMAMLGAQNLVAGLAGNNPPSLLG
ncbi:MAG: bifunctional glyoxylate/hydroxypyruvate reductase [Paenibacillaceae bacterium]|jgi:gluconate 2-dehydrogenase|nr:bifunctional glyoxylate/hydroxypyruvate reductase [Paenibacillaceae bacterium]